MDSFDTKTAQSNTYWWITSLAISVVCCAILFVVFASYLFQMKEDLAVQKVHSDITESRLNEITLEIQILNRRSTVQQIQIIPANGQSGAAEPVSPDAAAAAAAAAAGAPPAPMPNPSSQAPGKPAPTPAPAKH
jgi:hypothetical protein